MAGKLRLKSIFTPIFILLVGFLVSCTAPTPTGPEPADLTTAFVGGNDGLVISFIPGLPPDQIVDSSTPGLETQGNFKIGLQLENVGEHDIDLGRGDKMVVSVEGINPIAFGVQPETFTFRNAEFLDRPFRAKEKLADTVFPGDRIRLLFPKATGGGTTPTAEALNYLGTLPGSQTFTVQANACYTYQTLAATKLCLTDELFRRATPGQTQVCTTGLKPVENWGAPVKITRLEQTPIRFTPEGRPESLSIVFDIEQSGPGQIFDPVFFVDTTGITRTTRPVLQSDSCTRIPIGLENIVRILLAETDAPGTVVAGRTFSAINCFPDNVRLINGRATVTCDVLIDPALNRFADVEDTLIIKLLYGHMISTQTTLTIHPDRSTKIQ